MPPTTYLYFVHSDIKVPLYDSDKYPIDSGNGTCSGISPHYERLWAAYLNYSSDSDNPEWSKRNMSIQQDLTHCLPDHWKTFNKHFIPVYQATNPDNTSKVSAGLFYGMLWTVCKGLQKDDVVLCPDDNGEYHIETISGSYYYQPESPLPHRRPVQWMPYTLKRAGMSLSLQRSTGSIGTCCDITKYASELEILINRQKNTLICTNTEIEDPSEFAMEKHLEDFLIKNWNHTPLGVEYDIFADTNGPAGQQYPTDTGPIDILGISKNKKVLLVIELKKGRTTDVVVGQIQRYMGYVKEELAEPDQIVKGVIIGLEADKKLKRALSVTHQIEFYKYQIDFNLTKS